jgi:hypothetical protein
LFFYPFGAVLVLLLLITGCSSPLPKNTNFGEESPEGVIALGLKPYGDTDSLFSSNSKISYHIYKYSPEEQELDNESLSINGLPISSPDLSYHLVKAKPGYYAFAAVSQQHNWVVCFNEETYYFEVKPGQVSFIGIADLGKNLVDLQRKAVRNRYVSSNNEIYHYTKGVLPPQVENAKDNTNMFFKFSNFVNKEYPNITAPIKVAELKNGSFTSGWDIFKSQESCWGYYK